MSTEWQTPKDLFDKVNLAIGGFQVDAAANQDNHLVDRWYGPGSDLGTDALAVPQWLSPAWVNPPYLKGKAWEAWLDKMVAQAKSGVEVAALLPANVGTQWWYTYVVGSKADIMFLVGRVPFTIPGRDKPSQPNHDSAIVCFANNSAGRIMWWDWRNDVRTETEPETDAVEAS